MKEYSSNNATITANTIETSGDIKIAPSNDFYATDNIMHISTTWPEHQITWIGDPLTYPIDQWTYPAVGVGISYPKESDVYKRALEILSDKKEQKRSSNMMNVYEVIVVDKKSCEMIKEQKVIAKDTETAMLDLDLNSDIRKKVKSGEIEFIFKKLGDFEKIEEDKD